MSETKPTYQQIEDQMRAGHPDPTVLVDRSHDKISTGKYRGQSSQYPGWYEVRVDRGVRYVPPAALTDEYQAQLAETLSGRSLARDMGDLAVGQLKSGNVLGGFYDHNGKWIPEEIDQVPEQPAPPQQDKLSANDKTKIENVRKSIASLLGSLESAVQDIQEYHFRSVARNASDRLKELANVLLVIDPGLSSSLTSISHMLWVWKDPGSDVMRQDRQKVFQAIDQLRSL